MKNAMLLVNKYSKGIGGKKSCCRAFLSALLLLYYLHSPIRQKICRNLLVGSYVSFNPFVMRYFMVLGYRGTGYHGWQVQPNAYTVQQAVHEALTRLLSEPVVVMGSGRTDTGVHARQQVAHFDWHTPLVAATFLPKLNAVLPPDISVYQLYEVPADAHARFSAYLRCYEYHLHTFKDPFAQDGSYCFRRPVRLDLMQAAARQLIGYGDHNYACFSKSGTQPTTFHCRISQAAWAISEASPTGQRMVFRIAANRFLRGMVRAIVGTMLDVGTERTTLEDFREIVASQNRRKAGRSVPAHGLYLTEVKYKF